MPFLIATTDALTGMVSAFNGLPGPLRTIIAAVTGLGVALVILAPAIASIISIAGALGSLKIGATIAGWAGAVAPAIVAIKGALLGLTGWLSSTFLPAILAFFSGPAGWTVLAVAAVVAMAIAFRKPIGDFLNWLGSALSQGFAAAWEGAKAAVAAFPAWFTTNVTQPLQTGWRTLVEFLPKAMEAAATTVVRIWTNVINAVKNVTNSIMRVIQNGINAGINAVNFLIRTVNRVSPIQISTIGQVSLPQFAAGGYVTRPTIAQIGEGGEPEYVVPRSKALGFANNIVAGRAGAQAIPAGRGGGFAVQPAASPATTSRSAAAPPIAINIQTGPVVEMNGQKYVSYDDLERAMRATADGVVGRLRTPYARQALGGR